MKKKIVRQHLIEEKQTFEGGATRSKTDVRFDLIPPEATIAVARRYALGLEKHGEGNWKHGDVEFVKGLINHAQMHMHDILGEQRETVVEDASAVIWGMNGLIWYTIYRPMLVSQALKELKEGKVVKTSVEILQQG